MKTGLALLSGGLATALLLSGVRDTSMPLSIVEERVPLRCLTPVDAAELVRHRLADQDIMVSFNPNIEPGLLRIMATPSLLRAAKELLANHDGTGSSACLLPRALA